MSLYEKLFADLNRANVRYVVVGGVAVVLQGHARLTADLDLVIDLERMNVLRTIDVLETRGLQPLAPVKAAEFADEQRRREWMETKNLEVFSMRDPHNPLVTVDLFARPPIPFDELWSRADVLDINGEAVRVASVEDLIRMKQHASRPQDLADIEKLEAIARERRS